MRPGCLVGCIKCGGSYHPSNHVRANPLSEALPLQCGPLLQCAIDVAMAHLSGLTILVYGLLGLEYDMWHDFLSKFYSLMNSLFVCFYIILFVHCSQLNIYKILHFFSSRIIIEGKWSCAAHITTFL